MLPEAPLISTCCPLRIFARSRRKYSAVDAPSTAAAACAKVVLTGLCSNEPDSGTRFVGEVVWSNRSALADAERGQ